METLGARTVLYAPPETVYDLLADFPRYPRYAEYLREVTGDGAAEPGAEYALRFEWWVVGYTVRSRVTAVDPPRRIAFEIASGLDAEGEWRVEPAPAPAPDDGDASRVTFVVRYDPDTTTAEGVDLPPLVSLDRVIQAAEPLVEGEVRRIVERVAADVEGERREVDLELFDA